MDKEKLLRLLQDVEPLIKSQIGLTNYRKYSYSFKEVYALYEDKVIDLVLKYDEKPYDELKYITLASLRRHTINIGKSFVRYSYIPLEEEITRGSTTHDISTMFDQLKYKMDTTIGDQLKPLMEIILTPPQIITQDLPSSGKIPNTAYLDYLGIPVTRENLGLFQKHRNMINNLIREQIHCLDS